MRDVSRDLARLVTEGIEAGVFPDADAIASRRAWGEGRHTTAPDRVFDLASLTKPFVASALARLHARGALDLRAPVGDLLPGAGPVACATIEQLLAHRSGLPAWRPYFRALVGEAVLRAALAEDLETEPGEKDEYSDLGYLVLGAVLERTTGERLDALVAAEVLEPLGISDVRYGPVPKERAVPTEDCPWRGGVVRGSVHDQNAHAYGRPAGHAGLFGTAAGVLRLGRAHLDAREGRSSWLPRELAQSFSTAVAGGTHALAWDTRSGTRSAAGRRLGPRTFGHLGFTGTSVWCDPDSNAVVVLLTNRIHPTSENAAIREFRPRFHDEVATLLGV